MLKHTELTRRRIDAFLKHTLKPKLWETRVPLQAAVYQPKEPMRDYRLMKIDPAAARSYTYTPVEPGFTWGPIWSDAWFHFTGTVPAEWKGKRVVARLQPGMEFIVWEGDNPLQGIDGNQPLQPMQGLDSNHNEFTLFASAKGGEAVDLYVQANGMNPAVSLNLYPQEPPEKPFTFRFADLNVANDALMALYWDVEIAYGVMMEQPQDGPRFGQLLYALNEVVNIYDQNDSASIEAARKRLAQTYDKPANASALKISAIGHAHIDTAWLWPLERTQYKCIHTFATATSLMDQYPEYKFICSQAAQYEWVKNMAPALYERIKEKVKSGQWEVAGSMWVEADCNLSSGESLIRQVLHGKNFFMDEFGIETKDLWLPDVFGYAAALPQILKKARVDYFLTQKISWNQLNKFPHHTFLWQGIDGTQIFSHFPPADTYNSRMTPAELAYTERNFLDKDRATRCIYVFGYGDGGGGPTAEMLENARRLKNVEGMPTVEIEKALDFFKKAEADAVDLPVWVGELYLELHRGTYTTQAANKRGNRKSEFLLRDAEFLSVVHPDGLNGYPLKQLDRAWKTTLLNQFHDIIPGSSVTEVYKDSAIDYAEIGRVTGEIISDATSALAATIDTRSTKRPVLIVSNLSYYANEAVEIPIRENENPVTALGPEGQLAPVQINTMDGKRTALFVAENLPLHGYAVWDLGATVVPVDPSEYEPVTVSTTHLENEALRVEFDAETGLITRIFDKDNEREILNSPLDAAALPNSPLSQRGRGAGGERADGPDGPLSTAVNRFQLFEDKPLDNDAWDIDVFYQEKFETITQLDSADVVENGPVRGAIRFVRSFGQSKITQTIRLTADSARIDFDTEVDWHESYKVLKVAFPVAVNSPRATYEIQYGHTERPTHFNTSWDVARFEVCAQKWVDLSEGNYGVALLNDCKYGHDTLGNTLRMTLLKAPKAPDPHADMGHHRFTYSLLPHGGDFREGEVIENAYALNVPPQARAITANQKGALPLERSFFEVDNAAVFIEAIKRAEKEEAIIVRLYEAHNSRGSVTLTTTLPVKKAFLTDLMETNLVEIPLFDGEMILPVRPFEITTVKFLL